MLPLMPERTPTGDMHRAVLAVPTEAEIRLQLEGRLEVVEGARERYARLESVLRGWRWWPRLSRQLRVLHRALQHEPELEEALARVLHRAEVAGWPATLPLLERVREVEALRNRVDTLARQRLGELSLGPAEGSLAQVLSRLEERVRQRIHPRSTTTEQPVPRVSEWGLLLAGMLGLVLTAGLVGALVNVLQPHGLEEEQEWLALSLILGGGLGTLVWRLVRVVRGRFSLPWQPLPGATRTERLPDVACFAAELDGRKGHAVFRPEWMAFLPQGEPPAVSTPWLVKELRWLPAQAFEPQFAQALEASGGQRWELGQLRLERPPEPEPGLVRFSEGPHRLSVHVPGGLTREESRLLALWRRKGRGTGSRQEPQSSSRPSET
jgi:hypothetical protein